MISFFELKEKLDDMIEADGKIGILTHKNPDGDGLCAALAMQEIFQNLNHRF